MSSSSVPPSHIAAFETIEAAGAHGVSRPQSQILQSRIAKALTGGLCLAGVVACTWISFHLGQSFAFTGFLYLVLVVVAAMYGGFWQATMISVAGVACLDYFFIPPIFSFANSPANWVALGAFEFTALVISRLSLRAHLQAMEAIARQHEMERLYETSRRLLLLDNSREPGNSVVLLVKEIFQLSAVQLFDALSGTTYRCGDSSREVEGQLRGTFALDEDVYDPLTRTWYCVIRLGMRPVGAMAITATGIDKLAATALASLCGIALERARAVHRESRAEAARQTEQLRTAVLDALAHEFKTPLTVARTASSGLLALGGLSELQTELVTVIEQQANTMDQLASRLLSSAMLDSSECKPRREPLRLSSLIRAAIRKVKPEADRERFRDSSGRDEVQVLADRELILTALSQLLDNALKYSEPGSPIYATTEVIAAEVVLTVRSRGPVIGPSDCERIFERFYRAPETQHLPAGTGLGLSIVRKIVEAHHGRAWAAGEREYGTAFSISLPAVRR